MVCCFLARSLKTVRFVLIIVDTALADLYRFDIENKHWSAVTSTTGDLPSARYNHGFASLSGFLYVFGGQVSRVGETPETAPDYCLTTDLLSHIFNTYDQMICYSGFKNDFFRLDLATLQWTLLGRCVTSLN
jgi:hypothetical protein